MRELGGALVTTHCDEAVLAEVATVATALAAKLRNTGVPRDRAARIKGLEAPTGAATVHDLPERPVGGPINPAAVPTVVRWDGESVITADVVIDAQFSGGEGRVHGGVIAGLFDDILSHVVTVLGIPAVTGRLNIAYRAPTPIGVPLVVEGRLGRRDGRLVLVEGQIRHGDTVTATAELTMVVVDEDRFTRHANSI